MYSRLQVFKGINGKSCFFWGPRQTGKSTLLKTLFPDSPYYDLLLSDKFLQLSVKPFLLREELAAISGIKKPVIIDEVQKIPMLLDEVQWMIVNKGFQFILCGSSARKLKRSGSNLLGGRALRYEMFPLVYHEIPGFDLVRALNNGLLPSHYPQEAVAAHDSQLSYVSDYLKEEIFHEAFSRKIPTFHRFLENAAFSNGEIVNYANIARDCGVSAPTVKEYFQILTDTLIARFLPSWQKRPKRRIVQSPKFYFFDLGIANVLMNRGAIRPHSELFGKAFEHFIFQELSAHSHYSGKRYPLFYWRTSSGFEVDFILGDEPVAVEVKSSERVHSQLMNGLNVFRQEYPHARCIIISMDSTERKSGNISIIPWQKFLEMLWAGKLI